jgi:Ca-activated chloride channel family protein
MSHDFHFIRPWWLASIIPVVVTFWFFLRHDASVQSWRAVCDSHLLKHLLKTKKYGKKNLSLSLLFLSALFMILSLAGPSWTRLPVPTYQPIKPRVIILDMSDVMLERDLAPDRLTRAKFKLHDLFQKKGVGQFGLIVYTGEPFIVSPLTDDAQTIDALLSSLTPDIMPVEGNRLESALTEAEKLIEQAGFHQGEVLVLTAMAPENAAITTAKKLAGLGIRSSLIPLMATPIESSQFKEFVKAGDGSLIPFANNSDDIDQWLSSSDDAKYSLSHQNIVPVWRDEGRWFLIPALLLLLPVFRRGWLQRIST